MQGGVLEYKVLLCWMITAWFQLQGLVLFNSLLTGLEEWPSEMNFVFFSVKAMLVPCVSKPASNQHNNTKPQRTNIALPLKNTKIHFTWPLIPKPVKNSRRTKTQAMGVWFGLWSCGFLQDGCFF